MADFIAKFSPSHGELDEVEEVKRWIVNVDGSSTLYVGGIGVILKSPEGEKLKYAARLQYQTTNNEAEYEALFKGLELAKSKRVELVIIQADSQLIINQVNGICEAKEDRMRKFLNKVKQLIKKFKEANFIQLKKRRKHGSRCLGKSSFNRGSYGRV